MDYLLTYSETEKALVTLKEKNNAGYSVMIELPDNKIIFGDIADKYMCLFDKETSTFTDLSTSYYITDVYTIDETGVTIRAYVKSNEYIKIHYSFETGEVTEVA